MASPSYAGVAGRRSEGRIPELAVIAGYAQAAYTEEHLQKEE
jgi:hypothetical protein